MVEDDEEGCGGLYIGRGTCVGLGLGILERLNDGRLSVLGERREGTVSRRKEGRSDAQPRLRPDDPSFRLSLYNAANRATATFSLKGCTAQLQV